MNLRKCRISIGLVIVGLIISGVTAFPLLSEINLISRVLVGEGGSLDPADHADAALTNWILTVREGLHSLPMEPIGWLSGISSSPCFTSCRTTIHYATVVCSSSA